MHCCALLCGTLYRLRPLSFSATSGPLRGPGWRQARDRTGLRLAGCKVPSQRAMRRLAVAARAERAHVLSIATEYRQEAAILQRSAELLGYRFQFCGIGEPWIGWGTKLVQYQRSLERDLCSGEMAPDDPVMLIDAWDTMIIGPADEFRHKMAHAPYAIDPVPWTAGERICGPDFFKANRIDVVTPDMKTPWRYPNAGAMCGRAAGMLQLIEDLLAGSRTSDSEPFPEDGNDQDRLHAHLLELGEAKKPLPYQVDSRCGIFQCLYEAESFWKLEDDGGILPRLRNTLTGERPIVLHGNGHTGRWFMTGLWRDMDFLRRVGLTPGDLQHLPHDGPVAPGGVPDAATEQNWLSTFQLYRIYEQQLQKARQGILWDPWKGLNERVDPASPSPMAPKGR